MSEQTHGRRSPGCGRPYRMGRRGEAVERTRERIVAATFGLHATIGPSRTTIRAIADRASVQRHTVYAHFPDLDSLYEACTLHGIRTTGMPEPDGWRTIDRPSDRLQHGLTEMLSWYRTNETMLVNVLFDVDPDAPSPPAPDPFESRMIGLRDALLEGWPVEPERAPTVVAVMSHALAFTTWRSLSGGGLADDEVLAVLVGLVEAVADGTIPTYGRGFMPPPPQPPSVPRRS